MNESTVESILEMPMETSTESGMGPCSLNNRFILEPYKGDRALKSKNEIGFAIVQQKVSVIGLRMLTDTNVFAQGGVATFLAGSMAYVKEELLFTQPWAQKVYESDAIEGKFIIVDASYVEFVK